ncbi:MAG: protein kinase, partial [Planctomycetes bacterium]|nr:protein kinase [Planctomycetota bacterium]
MDQEREPRLRRLEDAIEAYLAKDETVPVDAFLARHEPVADLLGPMLRPADEGENEAPSRRRIGDLDLVREIGRGGMGVVYEAEDALLKRRVAVKLMTRSAETPPSSIVRFRREAELAASLKHPAVVPVHSLGETDEAFYLVMELERAASLAEVFAELRGLDVATARPGMLREAITCAVANRFPDAPPAPTTSTDGHARTAAAIVLQVAEALGQAHAKGVIHRDVKPGNILVEPSGRAYLTDFGLACVQSDPAVTQAGSAPGTPQYMAPEQVRGDRDALGPPTDVFALGATLYEALTLRRAFPGESVTAVLFAVTHRDPVDPSRLVPTLPRDLVAIVQRALEKDPAARYPTAAEFAADLAAFLRGDPVSARPVNYLGRLRRQAAREPWRALVALLVAIGLPALVFLAIAANRRDSQTQLGEQVQQAAWLDTQLAHGFREAGEGDLVAAQECFTAILEKAPDHEEGIAGLSVVARTRGDAAALEVLRRHPAALQASAALRRRQAELLRRLGKEDAANAVARDLVAEPIDFDAFLYGYADLELGHAGDDAAFARAKRLLHRAIVSSDHPRPLYYYEWLHAAAHTGDADDVDAATAAIEKLWPDAASSWFWISFARDRLDDTTGAIAALERALRIDPDFLSAALNRARLLRRSGHNEAAITQLRELLDTAPRPALVHRELAVALAAAKDYRGALQSYRAALPAFGNDPAVQREYAGALVATGAAAAGAKVLTDILERNPDDLGARLALGTTLQRMNRNAEAREQLQLCVTRIASA